MRFTRKTLKRINEWFAKYNYDLTCVYGKSMSYSPSDNEIIVAKKYDNSTDNYFVDFLRENGLKENYNAITLSLLHEIGHYETENLFSELQWEVESIMKDSLYTKIKDTKKLNYTYWSFPTELLANKWVVKTANRKRNKRKIKELEKILLATMR